MSDAEIPNRPSLFPPDVAEGGVVLTLTPDQLYVEFTETQSPSEIAEILTEHQLRVVESRDVQAVSRDRTLPDDAELGHQLWLQSATGEDTTRLIMTLRADSRVSIASPVYHRADLLPAVSGLSFTDQVLVRVAPTVDDAAANDLIQSLGADVVSVVQNEQYGAIYQVRVAQDQDLFALVRAFAQSPLVTYAGVDWRQLSSPACGWTPNDPFFSNQWHLTRIEAPEGWDLTTGTPHVTIAIIDSGCDVTHPDLVANLVPVADRFDALTGTNTLRDVLGHGTCCAGIAAAATNNAQGVAGVAPRCMIMPIRLWRGSLFDPFIHSELDIVRCVDWARTHGADVVSMSWWWGGPHALADTALDQAYQANLVLVGSAGNDNIDSIIYPGSHRQVMTVGAVDQNDQRKRPSSPDGENWGSQYGPKLSVMAPGVRCWTTDVTDPPRGSGVPIDLGLRGGYNHRDPKLGSADGSYFAFMNGTSAAVPQVAGLAALILSIQSRHSPWAPYLQTPPKNNFSNYQVQQIIETTADRVGGYAYHSQDWSHPHGRWHREMGYGRINVGRALVYALNYDAHRFDLDDKLVVDILIGLIAGGAGIVLPPGGPPVPVDPNWRTLLPGQRDVVLGLAITELAKHVHDPGVRQEIANVGWTAIARVAGQMKSS